MDEHRTPDEFADRLDELLADLPADRRKLLRKEFEDWASNWTDLVSSTESAAYG